MALAGEDDDDDDEETTSRRGSNVKNAAPVVKSLKGKDSFKARMPSRAEISRMADATRSSSKGKERRGKDRSRRREKRAETRKSFIDGILSDEESESSESERAVKVEEAEYRTKRRRRDDHGESEHPVGSQPGELELTNVQSLAGLQYAMNLHQGHPQQEPEALGNFFAHTQPPINIPHLNRIPPSSYPFRVPPSKSGGHAHPPLEMPMPQYSPFPMTHTPGAYHQPSNMLNPIPPNLAQHYSQAQHAHPQPGLLPGNMQWDQNLLAKYAEFQLQQNHQRQQRALLEKQRQQLAELGIPVEDKSLLDRLFGIGGGGQSNQLPPAPEMSNAASTSHSEPFEWPTVSPNATGGENRGQSPQAKHLGDDIPWGLSQEGDPFPSPATPEGMRGER